MGTTTPLAQSSEPGRNAAPPETAGEQALVPVTQSGERAAPLRLTPCAARLPVELDVVVPLRDFRVRNLLSLEPGALVESQWGHGDDVPLAAGEVQLAWAEFEVVDTELAVRLTRLA